MGEEGVGCVVPCALGGATATHPLSPRRVHRSMRWRLSLDSPPPPRAQSMLTCALLVNMAVSALTTHLMGLTSNLLALNLAVVAVPAVAYYLIQACALPPRPA